ncbi:MAG: hypothetical protein PHR68_03950 [Candidatus Gracilibacteria bacterium]|nr:hypothetical protein [Candidatus Gracilibacteria bacterium]
MGLNSKNTSESTNFSVEGNKFFNLELDLSSVNIRNLESFGFKLFNRKEVKGKFYHDFIFPDDFKIKFSGFSEFGNYFGFQNRGKGYKDYIIENKEGTQFCILGGILTKSIKEIEEDIKKREEKIEAEIQKNAIKKHQEQVRESMCSTLQLGSYRSNNLRFGENMKGGFLPACYIAENKEGYIEELEKLGFNIVKNEEYLDLYDIKIPENFIFKELDYHLEIFSEKGDKIINFYYKRNFGKIINLDLQEVF